MLFASMGVHDITAIKVQRSRLNSGCDLIEFIFVSDGDSLRVTAFSNARLEFVDDKRTNQELDAVARALNERNPEKAFA